MTRPSASTFPDHKYDFEDCVFVKAIGIGGVVKAICREDDTWQYLIPELPGYGTAWWKEDQLAPACPRCFACWDEKTRCDRCGLSPDELNHN